MTCLLMLDFDHRLVSAVTRALQEEGVTVVGAETLEDALVALAQQPFDAALLDGDVIEAEELAAFANIPLIFTTSLLGPEGEHQFFLQARLLRKPFTSTELLAALHDIWGAPRSTLPGLIDVLRRAHSQGASLALDVGGASVFMEEGELVHAELGARVGELALAEVLARSACTPILIPERKGVRTISRPFQTLMLDLLQHLEEREQERPGSPQRDETAPFGKGPRT